MLGYALFLPLQTIICLKRSGLYGTCKKPDKNRKQTETADRLSTLALNLTRYTEHSMYANLLFLSESEMTR